MKEKEKEQNRQSSNWLPWVLIGALGMFIIMGALGGWFKLPAATAGAQTVPTLVYVAPTATSIPQVVVQAAADPIAQQQLAPDASAGSNSTNGQTDGDKESGALTNTDGDHNGDTVGGDQNTTIIVNAPVAEAAALLEQTTDVVANAAGGQGTALTPCTGMNTVGAGQVLYTVKEFESMTQPIDPRTPAEEFQRIAEEQGSEATAARPAMQSCLLTADAVAETACAFGYTYVLFKPETDLAGWFWVGPQPHGIAIANAVVACEG